MSVSPGGGVGAGPDSQGSRQRRERATASAQFSHQSSFARALTSSNPQQEKQLDTHLRTIDAKKRMRATEMFINQRRFFIDKVFSGGHVLRYAKVGETESQASTGDGASSDQSQTTTTPPLAQGLGSSSGSEDTETESDTPRSKKRSPGEKPAPFKRKGSSDSLASKLFRPPADEALISKSHNLSCIQRAERRLLQHDPLTAPASPRPTSRAQQAERAAALSAGRSRRRSSEEMKSAAAAAGRTYKYASPRSKSSFKSRNEALDAAKELRKKLQVHGVTQVGSLTQDNVEQMSHDDRPDQERVKHYVENNSSSKTPHNNHHRQSIKAHFSQAVPTSPEPGIHSLEKQYLNLSFHDDDLKPQRQLRHERLLQKLTQSLPLPLLAHTEEYTQSLTRVLGYAARNAALLDRERARSAHLSSGDPRFEALMNHLTDMDVEGNRTGFPMLTS